MSHERIDRYSCNRCGATYEAEEQQVEVPPDWMSFDIHIGDEKGIGQDPDDLDGYFRHYCKICTPIILALISTYFPSKMPVETRGAEKPERSEQSKSRELKAEKGKRRAKSPDAHHAKKDQPNGGGSD